jgi:membrane-anchored protein YejM (alkaline phosphatase superfamily)
VDVEHDTAECQVYFLYVIIACVVVLTFMAKLMLLMLLSMFAQNDVRWILLFYYACYCQPHTQRL